MPGRPETFAAERERDYTMVASKREAQALDDTKSTFLWEKTPRGISTSKVKRLSLWDPSVTKKTLPRNLSDFPNLLCLGVSLHLVPHLPVELLAKLKTLIVHPGGAKPTSLPKEAKLPKLETILADERLLGFDPAQVPNVRRLALKVKDAQQLASLAKLTKLEDLVVGPIPDGKIFALLKSHPIRRLSLMRGNLSKLKGIEALSKVEDLTIKGMNKLVDVSAVRRMRGLRLLDFSFCPAIGDVRFLAKMKALKAVTFWGCSDRKKTITKALPMLVAAKVPVESELLDDLEDEDEDDDD